MTELLQAALSRPNLPATGLLIFVLLYWLTVIVGLLDFKTLDIDVDADGHHDLGHEAHMGVSWLNHALAFFNLGRVPLMVFLSFVALPLWVGSILVNYYTGNQSGLLGLLFTVPLFIGSLLVAKVLTTPFVRLFASLEKDHADHTNPVGKICTVLLPTTRERLGQAAVRTGEVALTLNVKAASAATELHKGDTALVIDYDAQARCYLIEPYDVA
jgi:uncharacterized membrane protein